MFDRNKIIRQLVSDDVHFICISDHPSGVELLEEYLKNGFIGYDNFTDDELITECEDRDISYLFGENDD